MYFKKKQRGMVLDFGFGEDRFSITSKAFSDNACSQSIGESEMSGSLLVGNEVTTPSGMDAREADFKFEDGGVWLSLIAREDDTLYIKAGEQARPEEAMGAFKLIRDSAESGGTEPAEIPEGIQDIWFVGSTGSSSYDPISNTMDYGLSSWIVATFSDGSVTRDLDALTAEGVAGSRQKNPKSWGEWQENNGILEIKWANAKKFKESGDFAIKSLPGQADERLDACFSKSSYSSSPTGVSASASNIWCFNPDGRFSNEESVSVDSSTDTVPDPEVSVYDSADKAGQYRIDGHVVQFTYNNGLKVVKTFGLKEDYDGGKPSLLLGDTQFR